jgi:hypothetical protein
MSDSSPRFAAKPCSLFVLILSFACTARKSADFSAAGASARRPISRVLYRPRRRRWPFLWDVRRRTPRATYPDDGAKTRPTDDSPRKITDLSPLHGLAPGGVCRAATVAGRAVRSYRTLSPLPDPAGSPRGLAVCFLWHCPWGRPRRVLPGTVFPWSPDFPPPAGPEEPAKSGHLAVWQGLGRRAGRDRQPISARSAARMPQHSASSSPVRLCGRKCRWKAVATARVSMSRWPPRGTP